jgi:hypothetical protein
MTGRRIDSVYTVGDRLQRKTSDVVHVPDERFIACIRDWYICVSAFYESKRLPKRPCGLELWPDSFWRGLIGNHMGEDLKPKRTATSTDLDLVQRFVQTGHRKLECPQLFAIMCYRTMIMTEEG